MRTPFTLLAIAVLLPCASLSCTPADPPGRAKPQALTPDVPEPGELIEDRTVYDRDNRAEVPVIRLTVTDLDGLEDVHDDEPDAEVEVLFQEGTFAAGRTRPNGMLSLRGNGGRGARLKPYKIVFDDGVDRWRSQKRVHLLKSLFDLTRARSYLAWEYFKGIRHMTSMRHQYVQVFLNGQDLGIYEWIENQGRRFLTDHGLDPDGALYNVQLFTFRPYTDDLFDCEDDSGEHCLETEENHDPDKIERMLDAVNDESRDINDVIDTHFQRSNYETWLAIQMLFHNYATASHNYFLYSPHDSERWYFLPWDYNGSLDIRQQPDQRGVERSRAMVAPNYWWKLKLHERYLRVPANVASLRRRIDELVATSVNDAATARILDPIHDTVRSYLEREPDLRNLPVSDRRMSADEKMLEWEGEWARLRSLMSYTRAQFERTVEWPMSVWLNTPSRDDEGAVRFRWDESYDLQGDGVTYDFRLARTPRFEPGTIVAERLGLTTTSVELPRLSNGRYYYTVIIRDDADPAEHWQIPFTRTTTDDHWINHFGVKEFSLR